MANKSWQELLEMYLTGTLSEQDKVLFERYLAQNAAYRRQVNEWKKIAQAVRADAESRVDSLPPLRLRGVHYPTQSLNGSHSQGKKERVNMQQAIEWKSEKRSSVPLTAVAALIAVVMLGGLVLFSNRGGDDNPLLSGLEQRASATASPTIPPSATPLPTLTFTATPMPTMSSTATAIPFDLGSPSALTALPPTVPPPVSGGVQQLDIVPTPVPFFVPGQPTDPRLTITPSLVEPIISGPARLVANTRLATGDSTQAIDWVGETVILGGFSGAWLYSADAITGATQLLPDETQAGLVSAALSPDGALAVTMNWDRMLRVWDIASGTKLAELANAPLWGDLLFTPDGMGIYSTLEPGLVGLADLDAGELSVGVLPVSGERHQYFQFNPDGETAVILDQTLWIVDAETGDVIHQHDNLLDVVPRTLAFNPDGSLLAIGTTDGGVYLYDVASGSMRAELEGEGLVMGLDFSPDGDKLAIVRNAWSLNSLWLYDFTSETQAPLVIYDISLVGPVFGPDGEQVLVSADDGRILLLELTQ